MIKKVISGGQTGADRGALDAAIETGIRHGGWCPAGRRAEDGPIPPRYQMTETRTSEYPMRTRRNVQESDGTLIFYRDRLRGGSKTTADMAVEYGKSFLEVRIPEGAALGERAVGMIVEWINRNKIHTLNVAGNRESKSPGIQAQVQAACRAVFLKLKGDPS